MAPRASPLHVGRYALHGEIASGGMATVHLGRLTGAVGFSRTVAVKRLHAHLSKDPDFVSMFLDEARLAARVRHPNVISTLDVVREDGELFLVMEYVQGESLSRLARAARADDETIPLPIVGAIMAGTLHGLHAAHEATNEKGEPLDLVHRDVSPQNVLVGVDGVARVIDFGVAKAVGRLSSTRDGRVKGKIAYMAPEQLRLGVVDRRTDIYAAGVVLWELLTGERLFDAASEGELIARVLDARVEAPSKRLSGLPAAFDEIVMRALSKNAAERWGTARQMARALEEVGVASAAQVGDWVTVHAADALENRARMVASIERGAETAGERTPAAEASSVSVATPPREKKRSRVWVAFAAGLVVAGAAAVGVRAVQAHAQPQAQAQAQASADAKASPAALSNPSPSPSPSPSPISPATTTTALATAAATPKKPSPKPTCTVKSSVDSTGVKHYFNDCPKKP